MVQIVAYVLILGIILGVLGSLLPTISLNVGGWVQAVDIINYGFLFVDPALFTVCFIVIITLYQIDVLWALGHWLIKVVKF